jgi:hypothetical protein
LLRGRGSRLIVRCFRRVLAPTRVGPRPAALALLPDSIIPAPRPTPATADALAHDPGARWRIVIPVAAGLWVLFVLVTRTDFIPIWDGRVYADCLVAAASRLTLDSFRCAGHASYVYAAAAAAVQAIAPDSYLPMLIGDALLMAAGIVAFHRIAVRAFPATGLGVDRALLTAAFAVQPSLIAATLQPGLDLPLVPAFLWCIVFLLSGNLLALVATGVALCFTKETGVLLYATLLASYAIWMVANRSLSRADGALRRVRAVVTGFLPLTVFALFLVVRASRSAGTGTVVWNTSSTGESLVTQFLVPRVDLHLIKYLALIFVLNFAWVATVVLLVDGFVGTIRAGHRLRARSVPGSDGGLLVLLAILTAATMFALTRFTTFGHPRYFLAAVPLVLFVMLGSLLRLQVPTSARRGLLGAYVVALAVSDLLTVDPVSRATYGTFAIGDRQMLRMTSITKECCGAGQDQLAYSAEFTVLHDLIDLALQATTGADSVTVVVPDSLDWLIIGPLDSRSHRRTLARRGIIEPRVIEHWKIFAGRADAPRRATFIALPTGDNNRALAQLAARYDIADRRRFSVRGYAIESYSLTLREKRP